MREGRKPKSASYIEVRLLVFMIMGALVLATVLPSLLRALDANNDNLDDTWEAQHGISTNAYAFTNLVGWWQLNGTNSTDPALDRSGHGIHGTLSGFPSVAYGSGAFSNALYFTTNSVVNFPTTNSVLSTTNQFTFSAWFKGTNGVTNPATIATWSDASANGWSVGTDTNGVANVTFFNATTQQVVKGSTGTLNLYDGTWHQVAATYATNQVATVYVDGVGEATNTISGWTAGAVSSFTFGTPATNIINNPYVLDEARLYNRALGASEVPQLPPTYSDLNGSGLTVFDDYLEGLDPFSTTSIVTSGFAASGLTAYYGSSTPTLAKASGDLQTVAVSTFASNALVVHVTNGSGTALVGAPVTFSIPMYSDGGLSLTSGGTTTTSLSLTTDGSGNATVYYKSGPEALLNNTIQATAVSTTGSTSVIFTEYCGVQSGLALWLKADAGVTQSSGNVSSWADQSPAGSYPVTQGTSGNKPTYVSNDVNGKPALRFNGSQWLSSSSLVSGLNADITMIVVGMTTSPSTQQYSIGIGDGATGNANRGLGYYQSKQVMVTYGSYTQGIVAPSNSFMAEAYTLDSGLTNVTFYRNGAQTGTGTISGAQNLVAGMTVGAFSTGAYEWQGDIAEVLVYSHKLTSTELAEVDGYLADKYGYYSSNATWPSAYSSPVQAEITRNQWNKSQADAYVAFLATSPAVPPTGLVTWLKADAGVTSSSGSVSAWADQSPAGNNAVQVTSTKQPSFVSSAINSKPAINFNGSTSYLSIPDNSSLRPANITTFAVVTQTGGTTGGGYISILSKPYSSSGWPSPWASYGLFRNPSLLPYIGGSISGTAQGAAYSQPMNYGQAYLVSGAYDGSSMQFRENGSSPASSSVSGVLDCGDLTQKDLAIGVESTNYLDGYWQGQIAEILIYNRALTSTERQAAEVYLSDKYGLYNPNATWPSTYSSDVQAEITRNQWNKAQADAYVTLQSNTSGVVTTGLMLWLKADAGVTQSGGNVSAWTDQTGNYSVTQATSGNQPTCVSSVLNGKPVLRFNGSQWLVNSANLGLNADMTMITVAKNTAGLTQTYPLWLGSSTTTGADRGIGYNGGNQVFDAYGTGAGGVAEPNSNNFYCEVASINSALSSVNFYRNGNLTATGSASGIQNLAAGVTVGRILGGITSGGAWQGDIAEVLVYDHQLTSTELQQVSLYLANKYSLPDSNGTTPTFTPNGGSYSSSQSFTIASTLTIGSIHYTLDGTEPTASSPTYSSAVTLTGSALVSAEVFSSGGDSLSPVGSAQFYVNDTGSTGLPTAATSLSVTAASSHELDLAWTLSGQLNYSEVSIYRSSDGGTTYDLVAVLDPSATSYADTHVVTGTSYQYIVGTLNTSGESDTSASSSVSPSTITPMTITVSAPSGATPLP